MKHYLKYTVNWKSILTAVSIATLIIPETANAKSISGIITDGGGIDDLSIDVRKSTGMDIFIYCDGECGNWFEEDNVIGGYKLKKNLIGKRIVLDYRAEKNRNRIASAGEDTLNFLKKYKIRN